MLKNLSLELQKYKTIGAKTLAQIPDDALNFVPAPELNSIAMIMRHLHGNFFSRFTDFLTTDGEKPWRDRSAEFSEISYTRAEVEQFWTEAWEQVEKSLAELSDEDLLIIVAIKGKTMTAEAALHRTLAHVAYHVGQIVLLARLQAGQGWQWHLATKINISNQTASFRGNIFFVERVFTA